MMDVHMTNPARPKARKPPVVQHGVAHGTPATRQIHSLAIGGTSSSTTRRKGKKKASSAPATRTRKAKSARSATAARSGKAHLVKGSAAAKKRMSALRAMRGKKAKAA